MIGGATDLAGPGEEPDAPELHMWGRRMTRAALVLSVVDTCTRELHLVAVETAALHRHSGRYPALCGADVPAASLVTAPARHCRDCVHHAHRKPVRSYGARIPWPSRGARQAKVWPEAVTAASRRRS